MNSSDKPGSKRGSILVTLLFLVSVLALLVATVANDSMATMKTAGLAGRDVQAKYGAYAGLELVMNQLRENENYYHDNGAGHDISGGPDNPPRHGLVTGTLGTLDNIDYRVEIWNNMGNSSPMTTPGGVVVPEDTVYMESQASDTTQGANVILSSLGGNAYKKKPNFNDAAFARSKMIISGSSEIDAWDSQGGWDAYDPGGGSGGSGGSGGGGNVQDFEATLGTDSTAGRTARLLGASHLNGHYRIGPGVNPASAFSDDAGATSGTGPRGGSSTTPNYGVATATDALSQIEGLSSSDNTPFEVDSKSTQIPFYIAPYDSSSLSPAPTVNNPSSKTWIDTSPPKGAGYWQYVPPAPVSVPPGGYESVSVGGGQTLQLSSGVYYFKEDFDIDGGSIILNTSGTDPVVVFIGKKATIKNARINENGSTGALQMAFTDEQTDPVEIQDLVTTLQPKMQLEGTVPEQLLEIENMIAPPDDPLVPTGPREGTSVLTMTNSQFYGNISGKNMVADISGGDMFGAAMSNVILGSGVKFHQDLSLKGSKLMTAGGWELGIHQIR